MHAILPVLSLPSKTPQQLFCNQLSCQTEFDKNVIRKGENYTGSEKPLSTLYTSLLGGQCD
jgi:hypothetical protein